MDPIIIASLHPSEGRSTVTAGLAGCLASRQDTVCLARIPADQGTDAAAEDDAAALAAVPACVSTGRALTEQDALTQARDAGGPATQLIIEAPAGLPDALAERLNARIILVSSPADDSGLSEVASVASALGQSLIGVVIVRPPSRRLDAARAALEARRVRCLAVLPEDRLLAGPNVRELAEALHASRLVQGEDEEEAIEYVMLGPISADPGQPYFLQHGSKAVINRFDKMDLHLAALATQPDCLILTGGQPPSEYLVDRVAGGDGRVTVLVSPADTMGTIALVDALYGRTRFGGARKITRAIELMRAQLDLSAFGAA